MTNNKESKGTFAERAFLPGGDCREVTNAVEGARSAPSTGCWYGELSLRWCASGVRPCVVTYR